MTPMETSPAPTFDTFAQDVYAWAYRLLGRHHDALDVVQDVFLKWTRQCADRVPDYPKGWLRRVTLNDALDKLRANGAARPLGFDEEPGVETGLANTIRSERDSQDQSDLRLDIAAALDRLTDLQRGVLIAKVFDGLTFARIAEEAGVSVSTVKTHYLRAAQTLRDRLHLRWGDAS